MGIAGPPPIVKKVVTFDVNSMTYLGSPEVKLTSLCWLLNNDWQTQFSLEIEALIPIMGIEIHIPL